MLSFSCLPELVRSNSGAPNPPKAENTNQRKSLKPYVNFQRREQHDPEIQEKYRKLVGDNAGSEILKQIHKTG